jgi:glycosyltransferase involved in cell wall biosynthesis
MSRDTFSIVVPCYETQGKGATYLKQLFKTIEKQTKKDSVEIVITDDSKDTAIEEVALNNKNLHIKYVKNTATKKCEAVNTNNGIRNCTNEFVKILHLDDFFVREDAIEILLKHIHHDWVACSFIHYVDEYKQFYQPQTPKYTDRIIYGVNTIGNPSVVGFSRSLNEFLDEELANRGDCELYYRLKNKTELHIVPEILVGIRLHANQVTNVRINEDIIKFEADYISKKHKLDV